MVQLNGSSEHGLVQSVQLNVSRAGGSFDSVVSAQKFKLVAQMVILAFGQDSSRRIFWGYVLPMFWAMFQCPILLFCLALAAWLRTC
jgi:hypothetical protein